MGPSLVDLLEIYFETKDFVIEELTLLKSVFKEHESLLIFSQKLVENIKYLSHSILMSASETCNESDTTDMIINTQAFSDFEGTQYYLLRRKTTLLILLQFKRI